MQNVISSGTGSSVHGDEHRRGCAAPATGCTPLRMALKTCPKLPPPRCHRLPSSRLQISTSDSWISQSDSGTSRLLNALLVDRVPVLASPSAVQDIYADIVALPQGADLWNRDYIGFMPTQHRQAAGE